MKHRSMTVLRAGMFLISAVLFVSLVWLLWQTIPWSAVRWSILGLCAAIFAVVGLWAWYQRRQVSLFADDLCETLDALISGRTVEGYQPYEDSLTAKVQGKLMQYFDIMSEGKRQRQRDKETIQSLVSDISHQVKDTHRQHQDVHRHPAGATISLPKSGRSFWPRWTGRSTSWISDAVSHQNVPAGDRHFYPSCGGSPTLRHHRPGHEHRLGQGGGQGD